MSRIRRVPWGAVLATILCMAASGACDAFAEPRVEPVVLTFVGDTVLIRGTTVAVVIAVAVNGTSLPHPRLVLSSSDPTVAAVTPGGDSLAALKVGPVTLTVRVESSILTDSLPTLSQPLRVRP